MYCGCLRLCASVNIEAVIRDPNDKRSLREQVEEYKRRQATPQGSSKGEPNPAEGALVSDEAEDMDDLEVDWTEEEKREFDLLEKQTGQPGAGAKIGKIVGAVFSFVGILLLGISAAIYFYVSRGRADEITVGGTVVRNELRHHAVDRSSSETPQGSSDLYHAVVEFTLPDGTSKTVEMQEGRWPKAYEEGQSVEVRVNPQEPLAGHIRGSAFLDYLGAIITGALGAIFATVGIAVFVFLGRR